MTAAAGTKGSELVCPLVRPPTSRQIACATALHHAVRKFAAHPSCNPVDVIGRELRVAFDYVAEAHDQGNQTNRLNGWIVRSRSLFIRPAVEPILISYWRRFATMTFEKDDALQLASALCGRTAMYSTRAMGTIVDGMRIDFEPRQISTNWLEDIHRWRSDEQLSLMWPIYGYARIILAHPFRDGNGRFARAFFQGCLASQLGLRAPIIAMAPAFYRNMAIMVSAFDTLSREGDWDVFVEVFVQTMIEAVSDSQMPSA